MTPERHRQISDLYHRALAVPRESRPALLADVCADDLELRREVESLLHAEDSAGNFLDTPAMDVAARLLSADPLPMPSQVGRYEVLRVLGRGGMGEVYLAEDPVLRRKVAIKVLRAAFTTDPASLARFEQEARAASSLNHPSIVTIHEIGVVGDDRFIAMEYVDGRPLSELTGGRLPAESLLPVARQLAQAIAVAHAAGIVHRDIKPENVMLRPDGYVKLLDFGVARLVSVQPDPDARPPGFLTHHGVVIGTPRYMSPEQMRGEPANASSDIFALGAVFSELATADSPPAFAALIRRMLDHDARARPSAAEIEGEIRSLESGRNRPAGRRLIIAATAVTVAAAIGLLVFKGPWRAAEQQQSSAAPVRFQIVPPPNTAFSPSSASLALSPDGRSLAFTATEPQRGLALWLQPLGSLEARRIPGTEAAGQIFWSPDSRSVAFADTSREFSLKTIDLARGSVEPVPARQLGMGGVGTWSREHGMIVVTMEDVLRQVSVAGSPSSELPTLDAALGEKSHRFPVFLPDGRHFLFLAVSEQPEHDGVAYLASVGSQQRTRLLKSDSQVVYAEPGYLLYMLGYTLFALPFDAPTLRVTGEPLVVAEQVERNTSSRRGAFSVSQTGVLAYRQHNETHLVWYDRDGRRLQTLGPPGHYRNPALSPDEKTVAVGRLDPKRGDWDVWIIDVARNAATPLISDSSFDDMPVWSPDGSDIAFKSDRGQARGMGIYRQKASGAGPSELLVGRFEPSIAVHAWSAQGLIYSTVALLQRHYDLYRLPLAGPDRKPLPLLETPFGDSACQPSYDGRWMAYVSDQSGKYEIYAATFPSGDEKWLVSVGGGMEPAWRRDGKELFYLSSERQLMAVPIKTGAVLQAGTPKALFQAAVSPLTNPSYTRNQYVVTSDGQRFLVNEPLGKPSLAAITVVVNWPASLKSN